MYLLRWSLSQTKVRGIITVGEKSEKRRVLKNTSMTVRLARVSNTIEGPLEVYVNPCFSHIEHLYLVSFLSRFPKCVFPISMQVSYILFNGTDVAHIGAA